MKFLMFTFTLIAATVAEEIFPAYQIEQINAIGKECIANTHVDPEKVIQMRLKHFHDNWLLKEYFFCSFKKMLWMDDSGNMQKDTIRKHLEKSSVAKEAMEPCIDKLGTSAQDTAYVVMKCYAEHLPADVRAIL